MLVKSNYNKEKNRNKRVIIYTRESRDDYMKNYERIEIQRDSLLKFCKQEGYINIIDIVMHDDMTGTDFSRLDEIKEKIINGRVDAIIMKDSSRLGRNQLESLKFVELINEYNVELIFKDTTYNEDFFPLEAYFNELRAKDDSRKIRSNLRHKIEEGNLIIKSHYGYIKEGNKLFIDKNVSWVIQKVFDLYLEGYGYRAIATKLNEKNILTPSQYNNNPNKRIAEAWVAQHVRRILQNEVYAGTYVGGTTYKVSFKSKKTKRRNKDEWVRIENHHEPIIEMEKFIKVQKIIEKKQRFAPKSKNPSPFAGFVKCGRCGNAMYMIRRKDKPDAFLCGKYFKEGKIKEGKKGCKSHRLKEEELYNIFKEHIKNILNNKEYRNFVYKKFKNSKFIKNNVKTTIENLEKKMKKLKNQYKIVYNDKIENKIPEFIFFEKSKELQNNISVIDKQLGELKNEFKDYDKIETNIEKLNSIFNEIIEGDITKEDLESFLKEIIVYDKEEITIEDKIKYNIDDRTYEDIRTDGGIIINFIYNVQHVFTNRWL